MLIAMPDEVFKRVVEMIESGVADSVCDLLALGLDSLKN
jgi:hypothetical protein